MRGEAHGLPRRRTGLPRRDRRPRAVRRRRRDHRRARDPHRPAVLRLRPQRAGADPAPRRGDRIDLWAELETDWLLLDAELLPWSAKAGELLRDQYAAVGAAARAALPAAVTALEQAAARGQDTSRSCSPGPGRGRRTPMGSPRPTATTSGRPTASTASSSRRSSSSPPRAAPTPTGTTAGTSTLCDRLVATAPGFVRPTRRFEVDTTDETSVAAGVQWWLDLTATGGEGMVVKPYDNLVRATKGWAQPGIKVRGREYLRIIYGPDYTEPANLERLRQRGLGHKRSMAAREYALGIESLERVSRREPLWRIHEAVFAVLALESEPVDPRL